MISAIKNHMKIAIPVWEERISPVFDAATTLLIVEVESDQELGRCEVNIGTEKELHNRFKLIGELDIDCIICGAISRVFLEKLNGLGIKIIYGISGRADDVLRSYLDNRGFEFLMPGFNISKGGCKRRWKNKRHLKMQGNCRKRK